MSVIHFPLADLVIGGAIEVHRALGPGLLESAYQRCLERELRLRGIRFERQVALPLIYKGEPVDCCYRLDLLIEQELIVEVKSVEQLLPIHTAQVLTYLKHTGARQALLMNFNAPILKSGIRSFLA
jgi:GxxExxY protein